MKLKNGRKRVISKQNKEPLSLEKSNDSSYLELLLDEAKEILAYIDVDLRYLHVNKAHANWLGMQKKDFAGKYISDFLNELTFKKCR